MGDLIEDWINKEVKLSRKIKNIEEDFSNGYLFGELLDKFNQITNLSEYRNAEDIEIKIANFKLLEKAFRDMEIKIDKGRIFDLINKKRGVSARFLYMIKMTLAKKHINKDNLQLKKSPAIHDTYTNALYFSTRNKVKIDINKNLQISQDQDNHTTKNQKHRLIKLQDPKFKFLSFEAAQLAKIKGDEKKQIDFLDLEHQENSASIRGLESGFHNKKLEADRSELSSWKRNMGIKREFEEGLHEELYKQANFFKNVVFESMKNAESENKTQIENFEKNLSRLGLDTSNADQKLKKSNKATLAGEIVLQKIREKIEANTKAKKERDRRKRKIQIEQKKAQEEIERLQNLSRENNIKNSLEPLEVSCINEVKRKEFSDWKKLHEIGAEEEAQRKIEFEFYERENNKNYTQIFDEYYSKQKDKNVSEKFDKKLFMENLWKEDLALKQSEMNIKKEKRTQLMPSIKKMMEDIFHIVDEVEKVQKDFNSEFLERGNWKSLMKNFLNNNFNYNRPKLRKKSSEKYVREKVEETLKVQISENSIIRENTVANQIIEGLFEECETFDYLNYIQEYETKSVIPNEMLNKMHDIFEIVGGDLLLEMANNNRKNKVINSHRDYEPTDDDIQNLTIPKTDGKNYFLTDIVNILVDIKFILNGNIELNGNGKAQIHKTESRVKTTNKTNNNNSILSSHINNTNIPHENTNLVNTSNYHVQMNNNTNIGNSSNNLLQLNNNTNSQNNVYNTVNSEGSIGNEEMNNTKINNSNTHISHVPIPQTNAPNYSSVFNNIPIKILFLGKKFSGRKSQIKLISENFGLKFYNLEEIIEKNLKTFSKLETPIENTTAFKSFKKGDLEKAQAEREIEEKNFEPIRPFVANIKRYKDEFQEVPPNYIFEFLLEILKIDFPEKSQTMKIEEIKDRMKRKKDLQEELIKSKEVKDAKSAPPKPESYFIGELNRISKEANKGFILMDYPYNVSQAKFLELKVNNYVTENEKPKSALQTIKQNFNSILDSISKPSTTINLEQGTFDFIFYMDITNEESVRRAKNRKIDPSTGIIYHMEDNQPNMDDKKMSDRLIPYEPNLNYEELFEKNNNLQSEFLTLEEFYLSFGHQKINLNSFIKFTAKQNSTDKYDSKELINNNFKEISNFINQKIKLNEEKEEEIYIWATSVKENLIKEKDSLKDSFNNTINSQINNDKNSSKYQEGLTASIMGGRPSRKESYMSKIGTDFGRTNEKINVGKSTLMEIPGGSSDNTINENMEIEKSSNTIALKTGHLKNNIQNLDEDDFNRYHRKLEEAKKKIAPYLIENIFGIWNRNYENYFNGIKLFFLNLRKQKESIISRYNKIQENFIDYLRRPTKKSIDINNFHRKYNTFFDEFPNLLSDKEVNEEFRKDVKDLADNIWDVIEIRKSEAIEERKRIMEVGFIEKEIDKFYLNVEKLFILEVEKIFANINIIREFYFAMDLKLSSIDSMKFNPIDIIKDKELFSLPIIVEENNYENLDENKKYPKLEKLYKNCFKLLVKFDETLKNLDKISKSHAVNNNSSESSLRRVSKMHLRRHHESTFVDEKREIFIYEEEMKNSIKAEKNKFKFRVTFIKFWAIKYFDNIRKISKMIYDKLDDWIISTIKAENDAMNNIKNVFEGCIEKGMKIRNDFEMDSFEIYKTTDIPFRELSEKTSIDQKIYTSIFNDIKNYEIAKDAIRTETFVDVVLRKYLIDLNSPGLPNMLKHIGLYNVRKFLSLMENTPLFVSDENENKDESMEKQFNE